METFVLEQIPPDAMQPWVMVTGINEEQANNVQMALASLRANSPPHLPVHFCVLL